MKAVVEKRLFGLGLTGAQGGFRYYLQENGKGIEFCGEFFLQELSGL